MGIPVTGWLDRTAALERLSEATVLLNWSSKDSHPLAVLEAMAKDVLVVASDIDPNRELLGASRSAQRRRRRSVFCGRCSRIAVAGTTARGPEGA